MVSASAAQKLTRTDVSEFSVLIPAIASWKPEVQHPGDRVVRGQKLVRAWIDLYALGWRRRELESFGWVTQDGWVEIALPSAEASVGGVLEEVIRLRNLRTPRWREMVTFRIRTNVRLCVGDKLATPHGVKGVVSTILPDDHDADDGIRTC